MNPAELTQTLEALTAFARVIDALGLPGLVAIIISGPLFMLCGLYLIEYKRNQNTTAMVERVRAGMSETIEIYRRDTQQIIRELGANQDKTDQYYRDNAELVKNYERIANNLQDVVVSNTSVISRLCTMLEERRRHQ